MLFDGPPGHGRRQPRRVGADQEQGRRGAHRHARPAPAPSRSARTSIVELWQSSDRKLSSSCACRCARRSRSQRSPRAIGAHVLAQPEPRRQRLRRQGWNLGLLAGPLFADRATTSTSTASPPSSRPRRGRPTTRPAAIAGWRATAAFSRRFGNAWLGALRPLRRPARRVVRSEPAGAQRPTRVTAGFGISWIFATSSQRVHDRRLSGDAGLGAGASRIASCSPAVIAQLGVMSLVWNLLAPLLVARCCRAPRGARLGRSAIVVHLSLLLGQRRAARHDADRLERARRPARRARRPDRRRQPSDHARCAARRRAAAARRLHHEGRADAQHLPRRRRAPGALHPQRRRPRHGARRGRDACAKAASW